MKMQRSQGKPEAMSVRRARHSDLAGIDALLARSYPALLKNAYPPSLLVTAIPLIAKANPRLVTSGTYFVVELDDQIVGAGGWTFAAPVAAQASEGVGNIRHVVTDHTRVRSGIGKALMDRVIEDARTSGAVQLDCFSTLMAVPFYAACGFTELGPVSIPLRQGIDFPAVLMRRHL